MLLYWSIVYSTAETVNVEQSQTTTIVLVPINNSGLSVEVIGAVIGGVSGALLMFMLALVLFLLLALM